MGRYTYIDRVEVGFDAVGIRGGVKVGLTPFLKKDKYLELLLNHKNFVAFNFQRKFYFVQKVIPSKRNRLQPWSKKITFSVRGSSEVKIDNNEKAKKERERLPMVKSTEKD